MNAPLPNLLWVVRFRDSDRIANFTGSRADCVSVAAQGRAMGAQPTLAPATVIDIAAHRERLCRTVRAAQDRMDNPTWTGGFYTDRDRLDAAKADLRAFDQLVSDSRQAKRAPA